MVKSFSCIKLFCVVFMVAGVFSAKSSAANETFEAQQAQAKQVLRLVSERNFQGRRKEFMEARYAALMPLANNNNYVAGSLIGKDLIQERFRPNWFEEALTHLRAGVEHNIPGSMAFLGDAWLQGSETIRPDKQKANDWYIKAANSGNREAQFYVAEKYASGALGLSKIEESYSLAEKALNQGHLPAIKFLITNYHYGIHRKFRDPHTQEIIYDSAGEIKKIIDDVQSGASRENPIIDPNTPPQSGDAYIGKNHDKMWAVINFVLKNGNASHRTYIGTFLLGHADDQTMVNYGVALMQDLAKARIYEAAYIVGQFHHKGIAYRGKALLPANDLKAIEVLTPAHDAGHMKSTGYLYAMALQRGDFSKATELKDAFMASDPSLTAATYLFVQTMTGGHLPSIEKHFDEIVSNFQNTGFISLARALTNRKIHKMTRSEAENIFHKVLSPRLPRSGQAGKKFGQALVEIGDEMRSDRSSWDFECSFAVGHEKAHQTKRTILLIYLKDMEYFDIARCD